MIGHPIKAPDGYLTLPQFAEHIGISRKALEQRIARGMAPSPDIVKEMTRGVRRFWSIGAADKYKSEVAAQGKRWCLDLNEKCNANQRYQLGVKLAPGVAMRLNNLAFSLNKSVSQVVREAIIRELNRVEQ